MAVVENRSPDAPARLLTAADLAAMPDELPSGPIDYELDNGRLIIVSPTGSKHGGVQPKIATYLIVQGEWRGFGKVRTETGVILRRNPDTVIGPDVMFITTRSLPLRESPEGYLETIPELIVEVRSKNDTWAYLEGKAADCLTAGAWVVWIADPDTRSVKVLRRGAEAQVVSGDEKLQLEDIIPGFDLKASALFED